MKEQDCWIPEKNKRIFVRSLQKLGFISGNDFRPEVLVGNDFLQFVAVSFATCLGRVNLPLLSRQGINLELTVRLIMTCSPENIAQGEGKKAMLLDCLTDARMQYFFEQKWFDSVVVLYPLIDIRRDLKVSRVIRVHSGITKLDIIERM